MKTTFIAAVFWPLLILLLPRLALAQAQFSYFTNNGAIIIRGAGRNGISGDVTIPKTINGLSVTAIQPYAFYGQRNITSISLPEGITALPAGVFGFCEELTNVALPKSLTTIDTFAFHYCHRLTSIEIPMGVTNIGSQAFNLCYALTNITIPNSVTTLGDKAFFDCYNLTRVTLSHNLTNIGEGTFWGCSRLPRITIPHNVTSIGKEAFADCAKLTAVCFRGNRPTRGENLFLEATNATVYYLPGTTGWQSYFAGRPTAQWRLPYPVILDFGASFGVRTNRFGFLVSWATNTSVVVEAAEQPNARVWSRVATNTLTGGSAYFSDKRWTNHPSRFYRVRAR